MAMRFWRSFFAFSALYNVVIGLGMAAAAGQAAANMGLPPGVGVYFVQFVGALIATFGLGYALVAVDPPAGRAIVFVGLIGKLAAVALTLAHQHDLPASTVMLGLSDILFALVFLTFLLRGPRPVR